MSRKARRKARHHATTKANTAAVDRSTAMGLAQLATSCDSLAEYAAALRHLSDSLRGRGLPCGRGTWRYYLDRAAASLEAGQIPGDVFKRGGNRKLPFYAWSTLPIVTCPGAGDCVEWCYSLKAWRYPSAFLRQAFNTLRLRFDKRSIIEAVRDLPHGTTCRLYVDGDFDSAETVLFWANLMRQRPDVQFYGYSKSWELLERHGASLPGNYALNLSSGSRYAHDGPVAQSLEAMPFVRGWFIAVPIEGKHARGFARYKSRGYHEAVRKAAAAAGLVGAVSCPGDCGPCGAGHHLCGRNGGHDGSGKVFHGPIVIGVH
jgi:hypothetical protein